MSQAVVLLVDDRVDDRELMSTLLTFAGYGVVEAGDGQRALELARSHHPDLIVSDILMPEMNGYEFVRRVREEPELRATPVIFCTANYLEREVRELALSVGVSRFISKPCPPEVMLATIEEGLGEPAPTALLRSPGPEFERQQLRVINDKLVEKVGELERVSDQRRELLGLVMTAQEDERRRIADGIHDDSLQSVVAIGLRLGALARRIEDAEVVTTLNEVQETIKLTAERLRSLLFELRPPELEEKGLGSALGAYLEQVQHDEGLRFALHDRLDSEPDVDTSAFIYDLTREILMNVRKHARASQIDLTLDSDATNVLVRVQDDGIGFDPIAALRPRRGHLGLAALRERIELAGGSMRIDSDAGEGGTAVELAIPIERA
jgi:signal transduction histidine kinase